MAYYATARIFADPFGSFLKGFRQAQADRRNELALLDQFRRTDLLARAEDRLLQSMFLDEEYRRDKLDFDYEKFEYAKEYDRKKLELGNQKSNGALQAQGADPAALAAEAYARTATRRKAETLPGEDTPVVIGEAPPAVRTVDTNLPENAAAPTGTKLYTERLIDPEPPAVDITRQPSVQGRVTPPAAPAPAGPAQLPPIPGGSTLSDRARGKVQLDPAERQRLKDALDEYMRRKLGPQAQTPQQRLMQAFTNNPLRQAVERANRQPAPPVPPPPFVPAPEEGGKPIQDRIPTGKPIQDRIPPANVERAIRLISTISQRLNDPNLSPQARQQLQEALRKAQEIVRRFNQGG